jgi:diguanylate cyclase (GGDEF)-like protein
MEIKKRVNRSSEAAMIYKPEFEQMDKIRKIQADTSLSREMLLKEFIELGSQFEKLLKKTIKITRVGDSNQRRLLFANEQIETQKEELSIAYSKLDIIARTDPLTKVSNRRDFLEKFQDAALRFDQLKVPISILMGDIDNFKAMNDTNGHDSGDFILSEIAILINSLIRKDDVLARWGGEEFIILLPGAPIDGAKRVAEEIRSHIEEKVFHFNDKDLLVTMTIGVSQFNQNSTIDSCIKEADELLYVGKEAGKNRVVFTP